MKIEIWSDIACPWCWIGKRRFEHALSQFEQRDEVEVVWRSYELDPKAPRQHGVPQAELLARKYGMSVEQTRAMTDRVAGEGRKEGIAFDFERVQSGNTFDAHRLIHLAARSGLRDEMVERLYRAYFADGEALGDVETLVRIAAELGLDADEARAMLESDALADDVRADEERARSLGITGVPFFAIDERYGISGAQPPLALLEALRRAWREQAPASSAADSDGDDAADACADGACAI
ncbi:MAG TPA: DsbA family oxidoreductase [Gemmatimonadales bacterium]